MNAIEFVLSEINNHNVALTAKQRERLLKNYKRDKVDMGTPMARAEVRKYLETVKTGE